MNISSPHGQAPIKEAATIWCNDVFITNQRHLVLKDDHQNGAAPQCYFPVRQWKVTQKNCSILMWLK